MIPQRIAELKAQLLRLADLRAGDRIRISNSHTWHTVIKSRGGLAEPYASYAITSSKVVTTSFYGLRVYDLSEVVALEEPETGRVLAKADIEKELARLEQQWASINFLPGDPVVPAPAPHAERYPSPTDFAVVLPPLGLDSEWRPASSDEVALLIFPKAGGGSPYITKDQRSKWTKASAPTLLRM